jgi:hypothetical protein
MLSALHFALHFASQIALHFALNSPLQYPEDAAFLNISTFTSTLARGLPIIRRLSSVLLVDAPDLSDLSARGEISEVELPKFGETFAGNPEPSPNWGRCRD